MFSFLVRCIFRLLRLFSFPCFEFQVVRACWVGGLAFFVTLLILSLYCVVMRAFVGLRIEGRPTEEYVSGQTGGRPSVPAAMVVGVLPVGYLPSLGKGKEKISEIRYPSGSKYLRAVMRYVEAMGPNRVEPSYAKAFAIRYRPPSSVRIWCPDLLTSYVVPVPKMVCFFEAAFENGLRFPLHPFIKSILQHFNVCSSQLSPNFWGILVGLLVFFRDKGLGVRSIALLLDLFSVKEARKASYIFRSKPLPDPSFSTSFLPTSIGKSAISLSGIDIGEYNPADQDDTLGIPTVWAAPKNLLEFSVYASRGQFFQGHVMFLTLLRCF